MFGREIVVGISEQSLSCGREFGIVVAGAQGFTGIWRRRHGVYIGIVCISRMGVMIESLNLLDLRQQTLVDLLHISARKWASLGRAQRTEKGDCDQSDCILHEYASTQLES